MARAKTTVTVVRNDTVTIGTGDVFKASNTATNRRIVKTAKGRFVAINKNGVVLSKYHRTLDGLLGEYEGVELVASVKDSPAC